MPSVKSRKLVLLSGLILAVITLGLRLATGPSSNLIVGLLAIPITIVVIFLAAFITIRVKRHLSTNPEAVARRAYFRAVVSSGRFLIIAIVFTIVFGAGMVPLAQMDAASLNPLQIGIVVGFWLGLAVTALGYALYMRRRADPGFASADISRELGPLTLQEQQYVTELMQTLHTHLHDATPLTKSAVSGVVQIGGKMPDARLARGIYVDTDLYYDNSFSVGGHFFTNIPILDSFAKLLSIMKEHEGQPVDIEYVKEINRVLRVTHGTQVLYDASRDDLHEQRS